MAPRAWEGFVKKGRKGVTIFRKLFDKQARKTSKKKQQQNKTKQDQTKRNKRKENKS